MTFNNDAEQGVLSSESDTDADTGKIARLPVSRSSIKRTCRVQETWLFVELRMVGPLLGEGELPFSVQNGGRKADITVGVEQLGK